jgi:hypothetical protein
MVSVTASTQVALLILVGCVMSRRGASVILSLPILSLLSLSMAAA